MAIVSYPRRLADLAAADPDRPRSPAATSRITRAELSSARRHRWPASCWPTASASGDMVTIALPNSIDWFVAFVARLEDRRDAAAGVVAGCPRRELEAIVELADPAVGVRRGRGAFAGRRVPSRVGYRRRTRADADAEPLPDAIVAGVEGADLGRLDRPTEADRVRRPRASIDDDAAPALLLQPERLHGDARPAVPQRSAHLVVPARCCGGDHVVVLPRFDAEATLAAHRRAPRRHRLPRPHDDEAHLARCPTRSASGYDLSSLRVVWHLAEPCPAWLKEAWIDWLGPERIFELYGGTEGQAATDHHRRRSGSSTAARSAGRSPARS